MNPATTIFDVFLSCVRAIGAGELILRENSKDKEFHFQNWFKKRLAEIGFNFEQGGRNSYPDFTIVQTTDGYELKGLAYPGRDADFDSNSQGPTGFHKVGPSIMLSVATRRSPTATRIRSSTWRSVTAIS